jgi:hypothetical protein
MWGRPQPGSSPPLAERGVLAAATGGSSTTGCWWRSGAGRPATESGSRTVGVQVDARGFVKVDARLRTTGDRIWAAGDAVGRMYFTYVAGHLGLTAMANALFRARRAFDYSAVPRVTFTEPEVASIGLTEARARGRLGHGALVLRHDYAESDRAPTAATARGFAKLVSGRRGRRLGATVVAPAAGESIAELAPLVRQGGTVAGLSQAVHAYPTYSEGPARAAEEWWTAPLPEPARPSPAAARAGDATRPRRPGAAHDEAAQPRARPLPGARRRPNTPALARCAASWWLQARGAGSRKESTDS